MLLMPNRERGASDKRVSHLKKHLGKLLDFPLGWNLSIGIVGYII